MDIGTILEFLSFITALIAGLVHLFPNNLTRLVDRKLFKIWKIPFTLQRLVGLFLSVYFLIKLWLYII